MFATGSTAPTDRRRHFRHPADRRRLRVAGHPAELIDWSFGGIGVRVEDGPIAEAEFTAAATVPIDIPDADGDRWDRVCGIVCRIDRSGVIGISFPEDDAAPTELLIRLMNRRLAEARGH